RAEPMQKSQSPTLLNYRWLLYKKGDNQPQKTGLGTVLSPNKKNTDTVDLEHFSYTDEYRLDFEVTINDATECGTIADFEIHSRASLQVALIWFVLASVVTVVAGIVAGVIGYFIGSP
ncbi:hypothetical protein ACFLT0_01645, partial [Chloroflexota bacterium]